MEKKNRFMTLFCMFFKIFLLLFERHNSRALYIIHFSCEFFNDQSRSTTTCPLGVHGYMRVFLLFIFSKPYRQRVLRVKRWARYRESSGSAQKRVSSLRLKVWRRRDGARGRTNKNNSNERLRRVS